MPSAIPPHAAPVSALNDAHRSRIPRNIGHNCPITLEPIDTLPSTTFAEDGYVYDRQSLIRSMQTHNTCLSPMTRMAMPQTSIELFGFVLGQPRKPQDISASEIRLALKPAARLLGQVAGTLTAGAAASVAYSHFNPSMYGAAFPALSVFVPGVLFVVAASTLGGRLVGATLDPLEPRARAHL